MRIISGNKKSFIVTAPKNINARPTTDKVKESLFNIIQNKYEFSSIKVLDIFAGTGNISYEFGSRGCSDILCVDNNLKCIKFINKTAKNLNFQIRTKKIDYLSFLNHSNEQFDIVFADPPYSFDLDHYLKIIDSIKKNEKLNAGGQLIIEHSSNISFIDKFTEVEERNYGSNCLSFFKKASL
tara:strand:- start:141 stop:686 length:546 start_codon:yes stop_codon:yes gene_type:complete